LSFDTTVPVTDIGIKFNESPLVCTSCVTPHVALETVLRAIPRFSRAACGVTHVVCIDGHLSTNNFFYGISKIFVSWKVIVH